MGKDSLGFSVEEGSLLLMMRMSLSFVCGIEIKSETLISTETVGREWFLPATKKAGRNYR